MSIAEKFETIADAVYEKGKKSQYDEFWVACQGEEGNRESYKMAFCGHGWTEKNFKPKYDIKPIINSDNIFQESKIRGSLIEILKECNVTFDTRGLTGGLSYGFSNTQFTEIPTIDVSISTSSNTLNYAFNNSSKLVKIEKIILRGDGNQPFKGTFNNAIKLEEIRFDGAIGQSISFLHSPLSMESVKDIIEHLYDYSGTTTKPVLTLKDTVKAELQADEELVEYNGQMYKYYELATTVKNWSVA